MIQKKYPNKLNYFIKNSFVEFNSLLDKKECRRLYNKIKNSREWGPKLFQSENKYKLEFKKKLLKTYKGYVRKTEDGIITSCNNAAEVLWDRGIYKGSKPLSGNGIRYIYSNDYFNFFKECYNKNLLKGLFYDSKKIPK